MPGAPLNVLRIHADYPAGSDAWDLDEHYRHAYADLLDATSVAVTDRVLVARPPIRPPAKPMGATTCWERWEAVVPDCTLVSSLNRYAFGAVADWLHRTAGGLAAPPPAGGRCASHPAPAAASPRPRPPTRNPAAGPRSPGTVSGRST